MPILLCIVYCAKKAELIVVTAVVWPTNLKYVLSGP